MEGQTKMAYVLKMAQVMGLKFCSSKTDRFPWVKDDILYFTFTSNPW